MNKNLIARIVVLIALAGAVLAAGIGPRAANAGTQVVCFRVLHASPDAPNIDVYVNRTRVAANIAYTQFSSRTWCIAAPNFLVRVFPANADPNTTGPLTYATLNAQFERSYVIAVTGFLQPPQGQPGLQIVALENPVVPPAGQFSLRVAHLAPGVPGVDLVAAIPPSSPVWLVNITFPTAQTTTQPAGTYNLEIRQTGTPNVLLPLGALTFRSRERQTVYILAAGPAAAQALAQGAAPPAPRFVIAPDR